MDLLPSGDQQQVVDTVRAFLANSLPVTRLHGRAHPPAEVPDKIAQEAAELGMFAMGLPEEAGGVGFSVPEEVLVCRELGRVVGPARFLFSIIAAKAAAEAGEVELSRRIAAGEIAAAYATSDDFVDRASLAKMRLFEYVGASLVIVEDGDFYRLLSLEGIEIEPRPGVDASLSMGAADLTTATVVATVESSKLRQNVLLLVSAMELGLAEAVKDMIVEYAKFRETFGRPIGSYQAVRHPCATMAAKCALLESQIFYAALTLVEGYDDGEAQAQACRLNAIDAALWNTQENIQLHGGIGITDEFDAHYFLKRANTTRTWFSQRGQLNELMLAAPARMV